MATQASWATEAPEVNNTAFFEIEDATSAEVALELCDSGLPRIVGNSAALRRVLAMVRIVAPTDATVLINGETGTGKELIAEAIHKCSERSHGPFVKVNCAAIPAGLLESELFGHERGAYTGAVARSVGRFERAHRGTLFLDEIGDLPLELQPKILRVIQERQFERLGGAATQFTPMLRVICATHQQISLRWSTIVNFAPKPLLSAPAFSPVELPPLRERPEDIPLLVHHFAMDYADRMQKPIKGISEEFMTVLARHSWPEQCPGITELRRACCGHPLDWRCPEWPATRISAAGRSHSRLSRWKTRSARKILQTLQQTEGVVQVVEMVLPPDWG